MTGRDDESFDAQLDARAKERWNADTAALLEAAQDDPEGDEALVQAMLERAAAQKRKPQGDDEAEDERDHEARPPERGRDAEPEPAANDRRWTWVAIMSAAAAMLLAWAWLRSGRSAELPVFEERAFEGGVKKVRGDGPTEAVFTPDTRLRWALAPKESFQGEVDLRIHAVGPGDLCLALDRGKRIANSGAIEIAGPLGEIMPLSDGDWSLTMLVGARETMESLPNPCATDDSGAYPEGVSSVVTRSLSVHSSG